jgi:hypothetical protein
MVTSTSQSNVNQLQEMLSTSTNNFGLAQLMKNFVLIGEDSQIMEVGVMWIDIVCSAINWQVSLKSK